MSAEAGSHYEVLIISAVVSVHGEHQKITLTKILVAHKDIEGWTEHYGLNEQS